MRALTKPLEWFDFFAETYMSTNKETLLDWMKSHFKRSRSVSFLKSIAAEWQTRCGKGDRQPQPIMAENYRRYSAALRRLDNRLRPRRGDAASLCNRPAVARGADGLRAWNGTRAKASKLIKD